MVWFVLTAISVLYTVWDIRSTPEMKIMKPGWVLVVLFTGPVGAALYVLSCKAPSPDTHKKFVLPLWKQGIGSTVHCLAGDATGIIAAAVVTSLMGFSMLADFAAEYVFGFSFGLLVFQALFMSQLMKLPYWNSVRRSFMPELLSMNCVMAGMGPVMLILMSKYMTAMSPTSIRFWGVMSLATLVGMVVSYPVNVWLVASGLKHGMGTEVALGEAGALPATDTPPVQDYNQGRSHSEMRGMPGMVSNAKGEATSDGGTVTRAELFAVALLTFLALAAGLVLAGIFGDLGMRAGDMTGM